MKYYFAPSGPGLGDIILNLPVLEKLLEQEQETVLVLHSQSQFQAASLVKGISNVIDSDSFKKEKFSQGDIFINMRDHDLQLNYIWGSANFSQKFPNKCITDIIEIIAKDKGVHLNFDSLLPYPFVNCSELSESIIFIPTSQGSYKNWPINSWLELGQKLKIAGRDCFFIGQPKIHPELNKLTSAGIEWLPTPNLVEACNILSSCRAVIGVDTGLIHLAARQKKPILCICPYPGFWFWKQKYFDLVIAENCQRICLDSRLSIDCQPCPPFLDEQKTSICLSESSHCLSKISCQKVFKQLEQLLIRSCP